MIKPTAVDAYFADLNKDGRFEAELVEGTLQDAHDVDASWTTNVWDDGVPVTKMFHRNGEVPLHLPEGTKLKGVRYVGQASGCQMFDFVYGHSWYSIAMSDAEEIIDDLCYSPGN